MGLSYPDDMISDENATIVSCDPRDVLAASSLVYKVFWEFSLQDALKRSLNKQRCVVDEQQGGNRLPSRTSK